MADKAQEAGSPEAEESEGQEEPQEQGESQEPKEGEEPTQGAKPEAEKHRRASGYQRKIERLEREREVLFQQLRRAGLQPNNPAPQPPKEKTPAEQAESYINGLVERRLAEREAQREQQTRQAEFQRRMAEARNSHPDFEEVVYAASDIPISQALGQALLTSERPGEIMYQLAKSPAELARISALPPLDAAREVGRFEAKLASGAATQTTPKPAARPPAPPSKVGGNSSSTRSLETLPISDYKRAYRSGRR